MTSKLKGTIATIAVFVVFAIIYLSTLYRGISPGASAHNIASALGLESGTTRAAVRQVALQRSGIRSIDFLSESPTATFKTVTGEFRTRHIVWRTIISTLARHAPFGPLSLRLNAFSALIGALTVALTFALCRGLVLFINFHDSPVSSEGRKVSAFAAAFVAAVSLGLSAPFWLSATRAVPFVFDAFLLIAMAWLLFSVVISQQTRDLFLFGLLWGISLFETDTGIFTAILLFLFAIRAMLVGAIMSVKSWCHLLAGVLAGVVSYIVAATFLFGGSAGAAMLPTMELFSSIKVGYTLLRGGLFGDPAKLVCVFFIVIPFAAVCALAMWRDAERNTAASGFLIFLLACTTSVALSKTPISPWAIYFRTATPYVPVAVFVLAAAIAGYLASAGAIMAKGQLIPPPPPRTKIRRASAKDDFSEASVGRVIVWFTICLSLGCGLFNWREIRDSQDFFVATAAKEFVARLGQRSWITSTTPTFDTMLRLRAWEDGRPLHIIGHGNSQSSARRLRVAINRDEAFKDLDRKALMDSLVSTNLDSFAATWISLDPGASRRLIVDDPNLWTDAGRTPIPDAIGYRAAEKGETPDWNAIAANHVALWKTLSATDNILGPAAPVSLRQVRSELRAYLCGIGENLADQLVSNKDFSATKVREILDLVEDIRIEHQPATRDEIFY